MNAGRLFRWLRKGAGFLPLFLAGFSLTLQAGGPLSIDSAGRILVFDLSLGPVTYRVDDGGLGRLTHEQAVALVDSLFATWQDVETAAITFQNAGPILSLDGSRSVDVGPSNFGQYLGPNEPLNQNIVVFDEDGSLFQTLFGRNTLVLGFAGPTFVSGGSSPAILESSAFLNGGFVDGDISNGELNSLEEFSGVFTHEFGHFIGLGHSQVNGLDFRTLPGDAIETMHPILRDGVAQASLHKDDMLSVSALYPESTLFSDFGTLEGTYFLQDGQTPFTGGNLVLRNIDDPLLDAVSAVSGATRTPAGHFVIHGLTPGAQYTLQVEGISSTFTGGSRVGPLSTPARLPGPPEFFNGDKESSNPEIDNPDEFTLLSAVPGETLDFVNLIANQFVGQAPEILSMHVGISEDDPLAALVTVEGHDPDGDVEKIILDIMSSGSRLTGSRDTRLTAIGFDLGNRQDFRFSLFAGDVISSRSLSRFLPVATGMRLQLLDKEGHLSQTMTQPLSRYASTSRLVFPTVVSDSTRSTGLALVNLSSDTSVNTAFSYDNLGALNPSEGNPITRSLFSNRQIAFFPNELFDLPQASSGWFELRGNTEEVFGFFLEGDFATETFLDGLAATSSGLTQLILPLISIPGALEQHFILVNAQSTPATISLTVFDNRGEISLNTTRKIPSHGRIADNLGGLMNLPGLDLTQGHVQIESDLPLITQTNIGSQETLASIAGQSTMTALDLFSAQVATGQNYLTFLNLVNPTDSSADVSILFRDPAGKPISAPKTVTLPARGSFQEEIGSLYELTDLAQVLHQGWLSIVSDRSGLSGVATFAGQGTEKFLTSLPLESTPRRHFILPHIAMLGDYFTGLTLLNPGALAATVQISAFDESGLQQGQTILILEPGQRDARLLQQIISDLVPINGGYILVDSDQPIFSFGVFGTSRLDVLSAIPGIPRE